MEQLMFIVRSKIVMEATKSNFFKIKLPYIKKEMVATAPSDDKLREN